MRDFKNCCIITLSFVLIFAVGLVCVIEPYMHQEFSQYCDINDRNKLAGKLDTVFIGASHGECAFIPDVFDVETCSNSYNLSNSMMNWFGKEVLLKKEISRNNIKTVYLEIAYDSLTRDYKRAEGDIYTIPRIDSMPQRLGYFFKYIKFDEWDLVISTYLNGAVDYYINLIKIKLYNFIGKDIDANQFSGIDRPQKGYLRKEESRENIEIDTETFDSLYNSLEIGTEINKKSYRNLVRILNYLKSCNIDVAIVVTPLPDKTILEYKNWDEFKSDLDKIETDFNCKVFDFNLIKDRYLLFDDSSFIDSGHMSYTGAKVFTDNFSKIINRVNSGEDVSSLFYSSYEEMKADSPYWQYMN